VVTGSAIWYDVSAFSTVGWASEQAASGINASAVSPVIIPVFIGSSLRLH
jgi:hypothetical protein